MSSLQNKKQKIHFEILLHDIRSVQNVASIFRLAECLGCSKIILSGITPGPQDRFGRIREEFIKISLGSENFVKWERIGEEVQSQEFKEEVDKINLQKCLELIKSFKKNIIENKVQNLKSCVIVLEQSEKSVDYKIVAEQIKINFEKNVGLEIENNNSSIIKYLVIPGREVEGLEKSILENEYVDYICEIPQYGQKESLNIFSSMSILCYRLFDF